MLGPRTVQLLSVASRPLGKGGPSDTPEGRLHGELAELLAQWNGFYAFESALHVFGSGSGVEGGSIGQWNSPERWKTAYEGLADDFVFFAEDTFGSQFGIHGEQIWTFDPETAQARVIASSVEDWADQLLSNYEVLTGYPVIHAWQRAHGALPPGHRLVPKRPFVLGGEFDAANVYSLDAVEGMLVRAELALQIKNMPDGSRIKYRILD